MKKLILTTASLFINLVILGQQVTVVTDKEKYNLNEIVEVTYLLKVKYDSIKLPKFEDFEVMDELFINRSIDREMKVSETKRIYRLRPIKNGHLVILSPAYFIKGNKIEGKPTRITVGSTTKTYAQESSTANAAVDSVAIKLEQYLKKQVTNGFKGSVYVVKNGTVLLNNSYGQESDTPQVAYWIASNTKPVLALAIQKLAQDKKLSLSDPITKYFTKVPDDKKHITIHHLLTHSSGLPHAYSTEGITDFDQAVEQIMKLPVAKERIGDFQYSNDGYNLLALLLEKVSGESYESYIKENIFKFADVVSTGFWGEEKESPSTIAKPYDASRLNNILPTIYQNGSVANYGYKGATGVYSTAEDQYKLFRAMQEGKIITKDNVEKAFRPYVFMGESEGIKTYYGYGWMVGYKDDALVNIRHSGDEDWLGHNSMRLFYPNGDAIVVLSNSNRTKDEDVWSVKVAYDIKYLLQNLF